MNKTELIDALAAKTGLTKKDSENVIQVALSHQVLVEQALTLMENLILQQSSVVGYPTTWKQMN